MTLGAQVAERERAGVRAADEAKHTGAGRPARERERERERARERAEAERRRFGGCYAAVLEAMLQPLPKGVRSLYLKCRLTGLASCGQAGPFLQVKICGVEWRKTSPSTWMAALSEWVIRHPLPARSWRHFGHLDIL